jgi:hypothetical protein
MESSIIRTANGECLKLEREMENVYYENRKRRVFIMTKGSGECLSREQEKESVFH